jgi:hypothetical protein
MKKIIAFGASSSKKNQSINNWLLMLLDNLKRVG